MSGYVRGPGVQHWHSIDRLAPEYGGLKASSGTAAAWPSANLAIYTPVVVRNRVVVKQLWYANGSTGTGNYDIGLYNAAGTALLRLGSTAKSTLATEIVWDCADTAIGPGIYYLALASDSASDTFTRANPSAPLAAAFGVLTEASAMPLPATATWGVAQTLTFVPVIGMFLDTRTT